MSRNLENYEMVKVRKQRLYKDHKDARITVKLLECTDTMAVVQAFIYKNLDEQVVNAPLGVGLAQEFKGQGGVANKHAWLENCEESAIGRALDNAGYAKDNKCSREEMQKVVEAEKREIEERELDIEALDNFKKLAGSYCSSVEDKKGLVKELNINWDETSRHYWNGKTRELNEIMG